jgi:Ca2+-binding RTX toxin-like protein
MAVQYYDNINATWIIDGDGTPENITGTDTKDSISGYDGDDTIDGGDGDDIITGGTGNDYIYNSNGINTYVFNSGDGNDTIDVHNFNGQTIILGNGITPADLSFENTVNSLKINIGDDSILLQNYNPSDTDINYIEFSDGSTFALKTAIPLSPIVLSNGDNFDVTYSENPNYRYEYKLDENNLVYAKKEYDADNNLIAKFEGNCYYDFTTQQNVLINYSAVLYEYENGTLTAATHQKYDDNAK